MTRYVDTDTYPTKQVFKGAVEGGGAAHIFLQAQGMDQAGFIPDLIADSPNGTVTVTNEPGRTWFAEVYRKTDGTLGVR